MPGTTTLSLARLVAPYLACRAAVLAAVALLPARGGLAHRIESFDANYYRSLVVGGYPAHLPRSGGGALAFFPGYPLVVRAFDWLTGSGVAVGLLAVSVIAGAVATVLIAEVVGEATATPGLVQRTALGWQLLPSCFVLTLGLSEGLFIALAAGCLLFVQRQRWATAAALGAAAALVRPTGLVFVGVGLACLCARELRRRPAGPLLLAAGTLLGTLAFFSYLKAETGSFATWAHAERRGWRVHEDLGAGAVRFVVHTVLHPAGRPWFDVVVLSVAAAVVLFVACLRSRLPLPLLAYSGGLLVLALTSSAGTMSSFPRLAFAAFPLVVSLAQRSARWPVAGRLGLGVVSLLGACALGVVVVSTRAVTP